MIVRRRAWFYLAHNDELAHRICFNRPVTRREVEHYMINTLKKAPIKLWPTR